MAQIPQAQEFCIKLSMSTIEGRPLSVTLARFHEYDNPLIGCSMGFLKLTGLSKKDVLGRNCRFLNQGLEMPVSTRERLHHTMRTGTPFLGVVNNKRYLGNGCWETFENLLHMVVVFAGIRSYILGIQVDVSGLGLDLADGSQDAFRLQMMFDAVLAQGANSWIHFQEGDYHSAPLYLYIRHAGQSEDQVEIVEGQMFHSGGQWHAQQVPDQYLVLAPQYSPVGLPEGAVPSEQPAQPPKPSKWGFLLNEEAGQDFRTPSTTPEREDSPPKDGPLIPPWLQGTSTPGSSTPGASTPGMGAPSMLGQQELEHSTLASSSLNGNSRCPSERAMSCGASDYTNDTRSPVPLNEQACADPGNVDMGTPTMKTQLQALDLEDPDTVLIARGVSKLGLSAGETLREYFSAYGVVKAVHIPYTFKKRKRNGRDPDTITRETRAPGRCFIVMSSSEERSQILQAATDHTVEDVKVTLEPFSAKPLEAGE